MSSASWACRAASRITARPLQLPLVIAGIGAVVILFGLVAIIVQIAVSVLRRNEYRDLTGDPWDGRSLEWMTSSPPAPYNFAVVPHVQDLHPFTDLKEKGDAYRRPTAYGDIVMPRNSGFGFAVGVLAGVLGFAMVWFIWWLAIACVIALVAVVIARSSRDDTDRIIPAAEVKAIEDRHFADLARAWAQEGPPSIANAPAIGARS